MTAAKVINMQEQTLVRYKAVQDDLKQLKREEKELKAMLMNWIPDGDTLSVGGLTALHKVNERKGLDTDTLKKDLPELWQEYGKVSYSHSIIVC